MACSAEFNVLVQRTESFVDELYKRTSPLSTFYNLIPRAPYPQEEGLNRSVFTIGRSLPDTDEPEFEPISMSTNGVFTGSCGVTYNEVKTGYNQLAFRPERFGWKSEEICSDDLIWSWKRDQFMDVYMRQLGKNTMQTIDNRLAVIYDHLVPKAATNSDGSFEFTANGTGYPGTSPDLTLPQSFCELTQDHLDETAQLLMEEGAELDPTSDGWLDYGQQGPIFTLQIGMVQSKRLFLNNAELREDVRQAYQKTEEESPLLKRLLGARVLGNFKHLVTIFPPRYGYAAGAYFRIPTWKLSTDVTKGTVAVINPAYKAAPYEGARVLSPYVFTDEIIRPVNSSAGMTWPVKNYLGEFTFVTGGYRTNTPSDNCFDPMEKRGRHFAEYDHAPRPVKPEYGRLIIFKRCPLGSFECVSCGS